MPFGDIHPLFLVGILAIVLIIFGPGRLPHLGGALGRGIREFRRNTKEEGQRATAGPSPE